METRSHPMVWIYCLLSILPDFRRTREWIWKIFSLKPSRDQDEDNDIRYSPIGSAVFELLSDNQTDTVFL